MWVPGTAARRLPVVAGMLDAARASGDDDLVAEAHLLRATALLELGDPEGRDALLSYITLAANLGHARGRWAALTRQATFAQLAGRAEESARLGEQALELGLAIGEPNAVGCFCTSRAALTALGVSGPPIELDASDPLWPMLPVFRAWPFAARGEAAAAAAALGDFSVLDITTWTGLEALAAAAVVFAVAGSDAQRRWVYERLRPHAGTHVVVGGCASYHAAVDHHLGALAASLGDTAAAEAHLRAALAMHERLGAAGWARLSKQALARLRAAAPDQAANELRLEHGVRLLCFGGRQVRLPDSKGLADIEALVRAGGADVHVLTLVGHHLARMGADPVLDRQAKAAYKARLDGLAADIEDAEAAGSDGRAEALRSERDALIRELAAAAGLGHRDRRLGDEAERARKTVSARVRDALANSGPPRTGRSPARIAADGNPVFLLARRTHPVDGELLRLSSLAGGEGGGGGEADEPRSMGSAGAAANPVQYALASLGGGGGGGGGGVEVTMAGQESEERYAELAAAVDEHGPVLDLFRNPVPVSRALRLADPARIAVTQAPDGEAWKTDRGRRP